MLIGLTFDLRSDYLKEGYSQEETAEFDRESTIEGVESALVALGYQTERVGHIRQLTQRLARGDRWDMVFNISEGMYGVGREAQVPCLLDAYRIPYTFSDPMVLSLTLHKGMTKRVIRDAGINTPDFYVITHTDEINPDRLTFPQFIKPVAEGTGKGITAASKIHEAANLHAFCHEMLPVYPDGLLVEEFLPGREFTVGITGTGHRARSVGIMEITYRQPRETGFYSFDTKSRYEELVDYTIPDDTISNACIKLALEAWRILGCRDGGRVDIRYDGSGNPSFIEVNPLAGLDPVHSDLPILAYKQGISYNQLIEEIMNSALRRIH